MSLKIDTEVLDLIEACWTGIAGRFMIHGYSYTRLYFFRKVMQTWIVLDELFW